MAVLGLQILKSRAKWSAERKKGGKVLCCFFVVVVVFCFVFFPAHFSLLRHPHYLTPKPG